MNQSNAIKQPWLSVIRLVWVVLALYNLLPGVLGLPDYYRQLVAFNPWPNNIGWTQATFSAAVTQTGLAPQVVAWIILVPTLITMGVSISLGLIIFWRKSNQWQGLLVSLVLVGLSGTRAGERFQFLADFPPILQAVGLVAGHLIWLAFFMFLILFPDGHFRPRLMRWAASSLVIWFVLTEAETIITGKNSVWISVVGIIILGLIIAGNIYRYRRLSNAIERQQIRWFLFAILVFFVFGILQFILERVFPLPSQPGALELVSYLVGIYLADIAFLLIPIAIGVAIFRYRLWDIDVIIRRTLQYSLVTGVLALVFFGSVTVLQSIFSTISGEQSSLAIALSTLAIAALFNPLRKRVQSFIDRRFYRQKYNSEQALAQFAATARQETDLGQLSINLTNTVQETLQPENVSIWLKPVAKAWVAPVNREGNPS